MVKIYTTPTCPWCRMAKQYFEKKNVSYEEHDVSSDLKARDLMFQKSHQMGVPVIEIEGEIIVGFNRAEIDRALALKS